MFATVPARAHVPGRRGGGQCSAEGITQAASVHECCCDLRHRQAELRASKCKLAGPVGAPDTAIATSCAAVITSFLVSMSKSK
eukprot:6176696-Alexandrium_andersonii.AAC.1